MGVSIIDFDVKFVTIGYNVCACNAITVFAYNKSGAGAFV